MTWDEYADEWDGDEGARAYSGAAFESLTRLAELRAVPLGNARVLDFGCGTGLLTEKLAPICRAIVAIDTSVQMIERLRHKIDRLRLANIAATTMALEEIMQHEPKLVAGGFDFVVCSSVCAFLDDYSGTVDDLVSLLRPGGLFVQWDWEFDAQAKDPHGLTRDQIVKTLTGSGLQAIQVETAFEIPNGDKTMRPLVGVGEKPATMTERRKDLIRKLLKGIETGDPAAVAVVDEAKYIQHNPQTHEGSEGLAALFARIAKSKPHVNIVRAFADGDFVFAHTEYDFSTRRIGFEVFRFEGDRAVEHWDNIQPRQGPNPSGRSMVDGPTESTDLDRTEENRRQVQRFVEDILIRRRLGSLPLHVDGEHFEQHNPGLEDGTAALRAALEAESDEGPLVCYHRVHRILAEGSFVLSVCEGTLAGAHSAFYDLFRLSGGKLVEHWDTIEVVAPRSEWKNQNGKF